MLQSKDYVITVFKEEISRKNRLIDQLFSNQERLEKKLAQIEEVLSYDEKQALKNKQIAEEKKRQ